MKKSYYILISFLLFLNSTNLFSQYTWGNVAIGGGGFVSGIITHKTSGDIYCRTDVGGAYRWDATNSKWIPLLDWCSDQETTYQGVEALALDPQNSNNVYILAATSYWNGGKTAILKSTDKGSTFSIAANVTAQFTANGNGMGRSNGERLAVDPNNSNILFCGTRANGLWKSTNGGTTWSLAWSGVTTTTNANGICFVVFDPASVSGGITQTIYVGISRMGSANIYKSTDGGATFSAISATTTYMPHRAALVGTTLYVTHADAEGPWNPANGRVYKLNTSTSAWTDITPNANGLAYGGVSVDPTNASRVIVSTINMYSNNQYGTVWGDYIYLSTDGGTNWTLKNSATSTFNNNGIGWMDGQVHWAGSVEFDPLNTAKAWVISGNGIFSCSNVNAATPAWKFDVIGLEETVPQDAVSIVGGPFVSVIGDYDGFVHSNITAYPASRHTPSIGSTTGIAYAAASTSKLVRVGSAMYYSTNQGSTWTQTTAMNGSQGKVALSADGNTILHSPNGSNSTYYSTNNGTSWTSTGLNINSAVPVADMVNSSKFYVYNNSTPTGTMYVSTNGGVSFTAQGIMTTSGSPSKIIRAVPGIEGDLWVANGNSGLSHSTNSGTSFTAISGVTYCTSVGLGKAGPCNSYPTIFIWGTVGGITGIFSSTDQGASWTRLNDDAHEWGGPGNGNFVMGDMNVYGRVYMSSVGRGIIYGDGSGSQSFSASTGSDVTICQGNSTQLTGSACGGTSPYTYTWSPTTGLSSSTIYNPVATPTSTTTYTLTVKDATNATTTDQVTVTVTPATSIPLSENFDGATYPPTGWTTATTGTVGFAQTGSVMNCNPTTNNKGAWVDTRSSSAGTSDLITPSLSFIGYTSTQLSYDYVMKGFDGSGPNDKFDNLNISVSVCGGSYSSIYSYTPTTMVSGTLSDPASTDCQSNTVNLSAYDGLSGIKIKFSITDNDGNNFYIDNINVTGTSTPTPVTLVNFDGTYNKTNSSVKLIWTVASESDMMGYKLYRSINPVKDIWEEVAYVPSLNSANTFETYSYDDTGLSFASRMYYKLVSLDKSGALYSAKIISVDTENNYLRVIVYPNPFSHNFNISVVGAEDHYQLEISDILGQTVSSMELSSSGSISLGTDFPAGIYFVSIKGSKERKVLKVLKE